MNRYSLAHLSDPALLKQLAAVEKQHRITTATLLAHLGEVDARKLYLPAGYPSMFAWCIEARGYSEDSAYKRIRAARGAREFPVLFEAVADGRLHLSAIGLLAPHLTAANAGELVAAAAGETKAAIEALLAERFPRSESLAMEVALPAAGQLAPGGVDTSRASSELAPGRVGGPSSAPGRVDPSAAPSRVTATAAQRYALQCTIGQSTHEKLAYARALLGHQLPSGDLARVLDRALDALVEKLERRKFAASRRPRPRRRRASTSPRHIPAAVKLAVWERDQGRART